MLRDSRQHARADLVTVVEGEHVVRIPGAFQRAVRTGLAFDGPSDAAQGRENAGGFGGRPVAHAASKTPASSGGKASPFSSRSAMTRRASACTRERAAALLSP